MTISIIDLPYLIELVLTDIKKLEDTISDPNTPDDLRDDCGELLMQALRTDGNLQNFYKNEWRPDCNFPSYEDLIVEIQERVVR